MIALLAIAALWALTAQTYGGSGYTRLSSTSPTACTHIAPGARRSVKIVNTGPATTIFPTFYDETGSLCAAASTIYGDGTTITLGAGQIITLDVPIGGLSYKLSGALAASDYILISTL